MKRITLTLAWMVVGLMALGGCYPIGHQTHSSQEHAQIMHDMNDPEIPSQHDHSIP